MYLVARRARPRRRDRVRLAVLSELRPRRDQDGRDAGAAFRSSTTLTTSTALLAAITERTKIVFVANPNNPTGTMVSRAQLDAYFARVPEHVLTVLDEAYFEFVDADDYPRRDRGVPEAGRPPGSLPADVLEDVRPGRAAGRLRRRAGGCRGGDPQGAQRVRRERDVAGRRAREPRKRRRGRAPPPRHRRGSRPAPRDLRRAACAPSRRPRWRTSSTWTPAPTSPRSSTRCSARA